MQNDTSMLRIIFSMKGRKSFGKEWTGTSSDETYARLYFIIGGEAEIWHHGEKFVLTPGRLYLVPPHSCMRHRCQQSFEVAWIHFNISLYGYRDLFEARSFSFSHIQENSDKLETDMLELISLLDRQDMFSQLKSKSLLFNLVANFFQFQPERERQEDQAKITRLTPALNFIDKHLGEQIKLAELAKLAAYEQTYFSSLFKQVFGISPIKYIQNKRIEKAQSLLRTSNLKLSAIADELGFIDAFHFSKTFKKLTGENPSEFRKNLPRMVP